MAMANPELFKSAAADKLICKMWLCSRHADFVSSANWIWRFSPKSGLELQDKVYI